MTRQSSGRAEHELATQTSWLHDHLLHDHGRTEEQLAGMPLAGLHRFEHVEHEMGLHRLSHRHPTVLVARAR
jgi:hypothetical protein